MWKQPESTGQALERKLKTLVAMMACVIGGEAGLLPAFKALEMPTEMDAHRIAALGNYDGVICWSRPTDLSIAS